MDKKELDRLQRVYPLFKFELKGEDLEVITSRGSGFYPRLVKGFLASESQDALDCDHIVKSMGCSLMELYPDLYISVYASRTGCLASVWVKRADRDAESVGDLDIVSADLHHTLLEWQKEAVVAKQGGWFFCSGHLRAEPFSEYGYFHFAGKYCKKYGEEHIEHRNAAARETYN